MMGNKDFWSGSSWEYQAQITNGAGGAGNQSVILTPGVGDEFELYFATITNGDTASRTVTAEIRDDSDNRLAVLGTISLDAAAVLQIPTAPQAAATGGNAADAPAATRFIISGDMDLRLLVASVAASQDSTYTIVGRIRGSAPTVTEAGASTPTITINTERPI